MNGRAWTTAEVRRAVALRREGKPYAEISVLLRRSAHSVRKATWTAGHRDHASDPRPALAAEHAAAARCLAGEIAAARAERATAPLLRSWPEGLWE